MKFEFNEGDGGVHIGLIPETPEEFAQLARFAKNAKAKKPNIWLSFNSQPRLGIGMDKISKNKQSNGIGNY